MDGQWLGSYSGNNFGHLTLNLEVLEKNYFGEAILFDNDSSLPSFTADILIQKKKDTFSGKLNNFVPINPFTLSPIIQNNELETIRRSYPNILIPESGKINGTVNEELIKGQWTTNVKTKGEFKANLSKARLESDKPAGKRHLTSSTALRNCS